MSWFRKKILQIAGAATILGAGGAVVKNPDTNSSTTDNDKVSDKTEVVTDNISVPVDDVQEFEGIRDYEPNVLSEVPSISFPNEVKPLSELKEINVANLTPLSMLKEINADMLAAELAQMQFGDLLEKGIVSEEFFSTYEYTPEDMVEMRNNPGEDAIKLERSFKKWKSRKNYGQCLGGFREIFAMELGVNINCDNGIRWASKALLDEVEHLFYMGTYDKSGNGNISKEAMQQGAHIVTQFNKGKKGKIGHIAYNCFIGTTQYEYSDGRQKTSNSLNRMGRYYGSDCKVYGLKSTKIPTTMASLIAKEIISNDNFYSLSIVNIYERLGIEPTGAYFIANKTKEKTANLEAKLQISENENRIERAKRKVARRDGTLTAMQDGDISRKNVDAQQGNMKQQQKHALEYYNRVTRARRV